MKLYFHRINQYLGLGAIVVLFSACASQPSAPAADDDSSQGMANAKVEPLKVSKPASPQKPQKAEAGSPISLIEKLEHSRRALYWREKKAYSFYIGEDTGAEYKPGEGLKVIGTTNEHGVECRYTEEGDFKGKPKLKKACQDIMYSLDIQLSE